MEEAPERLKKKDLAMVIHVFTFVSFGIANVSILLYVSILLHVFFFTSILLYVSVTLWAMLPYHGGEAFHCYSIGPLSAIERSGHSGHKKQSGSGAIAFLCPLSCFLWEIF
jgi:hypothetical protein